MPHLLEVYALALDAAACGNSDRHSDNLEAETERQAAISPPGIMRALQRLPDLQMTIGARQRSDWSAV